MQRECGICLEQVLLSSDAGSATSSNQSEYTHLLGFTLTCPSNHAYCVPCLSTYIRIRLGTGRLARSPFPIPCPCCPDDSWEFEYEEAEKILSSSIMRIWSQRLSIASRTAVHCFNPTCKQIIFPPNSRLAPAKITCKSCGENLCLRCETEWHEGKPCVMNQVELTSSVRKADAKLRKLAGAEQWRRCPNCGIVIELIDGCPHTRCICGFEFCYRCGKQWANKTECGTKTCKPHLSDWWATAHGDDIPDKLPKQSFCIIS